MSNHIVYFSAEHGLSPDLPIYAGGLGVLAGDYLMEADRGRVPLIGVGIWYHEGFFRQKIDRNGEQIEEDVRVDPRKLGLQEVLDPSTSQPLTVEVEFPAESAEIKVWCKKIGSVPLYLLDAQVPVNEPWEQEYTAHLYPPSENSSFSSSVEEREKAWLTPPNNLTHGGRGYTKLFGGGESWSPKLAQEILLGVGGVRLIRKLGIPVSLWHINDDHAAFCILERLREELHNGLRIKEACQKVRSQTVFTTHTPVVGAESCFEPEDIWPYLEVLFKGSPITKEELLNLGELDLKDQKQFSFTVLALRMSVRVNAVSAKHQEVAQKIWHSALVSKPREEVTIFGILNGVNAKRWIASSMDDLYQRYLGGDYQERVAQLQTWQQLEGQNILTDLWQARLECKRRLINRIKKNLSIEPYRRFISKVAYPLSPESLFICFARRFTPYKRPTLILKDRERLRKILLNPSQPVFLVFAGKAHPADEVGKALLREVIQITKDPSFEGHVFFLPNYDLGLAKLLVSGVDVWLNNPLPPWEASGTSGMKAILNGVLNLSVADGWWWEKGNNQVGWTIGDPDPDLDNLPSDEELAQDLYEILEKEVIPLYYEVDRESLPVGWLEKIITALPLLVPFVTTQRMLKDYRERLYHPTPSSKSK